MAKKEPLILDYGDEELVELLGRLDKGPVYPVTNVSENKKYYFRKREDAVRYEESDYDPAYATEEFGLVDSFDIKPPREIVLNEPTYNSYTLSGSTGNKLQYTFYTAEASGSQTYEAVLVSYRIENSKGSQTASARYNARAQVTFSLDRYLADGENNITVQIKGLATKASKTQVFTINVINLSLVSPFSVANIFNAGDEYSFQYIATGSMNMNVEIYVDGGLITTQTVTAGQSGTAMNVLVRPGMLSSNQRSIGKHTLQARASIQIEGMDTPFYSNKIYREYTIAGSQTPLITIARDTADGSQILIGQDTQESLLITAEQYVPTNIAWGLYLSSVSGKVPNVAWRLAPYGEHGDDDFVALRTFPITETENNEERNLAFVHNDIGLYWLEAYVDDVLVSRYKVDVVKNTSGIEETSGAVCRLLALGRDNTELEADRERWQYTNEQGETITTQFHNVAWNGISGWNGEAIVLSGGATAEINVKPFLASTAGTPTSRGCTVEIEFETFNVSDEDVNVITVGDMINITPVMARMSAFKTTATANPSKVTTNFAKNQKIKLQFVITPSDTTIYNEGRVFFIMANGVIDRMSAYGLSETFSDNDAIIKLGDPTGKSGVKVYGVRTYNTWLTTTQCFNNYVVDAPSVSSDPSVKLMSELVEDNAIFDLTSSDRTNPNYAIVSTKIPTMLITGDVQRLITARDKVTGLIIADEVEWQNPWDPMSNWTAEHMTFRRHGQSTLNYPVPSLKFWTDKDGTILYDANGVVINKGRWSMKEGAMPMKKYILQAYYVDSSCAKSPALLSILNDAYYDCIVDGKAVLRTPPQEYSIDQYPIDMVAVHGGNAAEYKFPYQIRTTPDSLPCAVFWRATPQSDISFLGQMVLMEDKKSDYVYGERSIYPKKIGSVLDPFDFFAGVKGEALWNNKDVVRFEMLINTGKHALFKGGGSDAEFWAKAGAQKVYYKWIADSNSFADADSQEDIDKATKSPYDSKDAMIAAITSGAWSPEDGEVFYIESKEVGSDNDTAALYEFENTFEMIYPDYDAIHGVDLPKYREKCMPLQELMKWFDECYKDYEKTGTYQYFYETADAHVNLWFLAAYYKVLMDNGLVDNTGRNTQLVTYGFDVDGNRASESGKPAVWYWIFWDLDTAYGVLNNGALAFGPRITRETRDKNGYAFACHDSFLWNALEAWKTNVVSTVTSKTWNFMSVLSQVTDGLNKVYNFTNLVKYQSDYSDKWPEQMYNGSEWFKYGSQYFNDRQSKAGYLAYLQGRGELYRSYWMATNFGYWNARVCAGDYTLSKLPIRPNENSRVQGVDQPFRITLEFAEDNFFGWSIMGAGIQQSGIEVHDGTIVNVDRWGYQLSGGYELYAMQSVRRFDASDIAQDINEMNMENFYDAVAGSQLVDLNLGVSKDRMLTVNPKTGELYRNNANSAISGWAKLTSIQKLNFQGWATLITQLQGTIDFSSLTLLRELYLAGANVGDGLILPDGLSDFYCELPESISAINMSNISFREMPEGEHALKFISDTTMEELDEVPYTIMSMTFRGMGKDPEVKRVVLSWLHSIEKAVNEGKAAWQSYKLTMTGVYWTDVDYEDVLLLGKLYERNISVASYIQMKRRDDFSSQHITILRDLFGNNVFVANNGRFVIDYPEAFLLSAEGDVYSREVDGETQICILQGGTARLTGLIFPLQDGEQPAPSFYDTEGSIGEAEYTRSGATLTREGLLTTEETGVNDFVFPISGAAMVGGGFSIGKIEIHVIKRVYPDGVRIIRSNNNTLGKDEFGRYVINATGHYWFEPEYTDADGNALAEFNGNFNKRMEKPTQWAFDQGNDINIVECESFPDENEKDRTCVWVKELTDTENEHTLDFLAHFMDIAVAGKNPRIAEQIKIVAYRVIEQLLVSNEAMGGNRALYLYLISKGYVPTRLEDGNVYGYFTSSDVKRVAIDTNLRFTMGAESDVKTFQTAIVGVKYNVLNYMTSVMQLVLDNSHIEELDTNDITWMTDISMRNCMDFKGDINIGKMDNIVSVDQTGSNAKNIIGLVDKSHVTMVEMHAPSVIDIERCDILKTVHAETSQNVESVTINGVCKGKTFATLVSVMTNIHKCDVTKAEDPVWFAILDACGMEHQSGDVITHEEIAAYKGNIIVKDVIDQTSYTLQQVREPSFIEALVCVPIFDISGCYNIASINTDGMLRTIQFAYDTSMSDVHIVGDSSIRQVRLGAPRSVDVAGQTIDEFATTSDENMETFIAEGGAEQRSFYIMASIFGNSIEI